MKYKICNSSKVRKLLILVLVVTGLASAFVNSEVDTLSGKKLKLLFLYQFTLFCEWPESKFENAKSPYLIGLVGDGSFIELVPNSIKKKLNEREVIYEKIDYDFTHENLSRYHIIFIADSDSNRLPSIIDTIQSMPIVTVSESSKEKMPPTMIDFVKKNNKLRFRVNNQRAIKAGVKLRSQLLRLAI